MVVYLLRQGLKWLGFQVSVVPFYRVDCEVDTIFAAIYVWLQGRRWSVENGCPQLGCERVTGEIP